MDIDYSKDNNLTFFAKATLKERYLLKGEKPQDAFARVARAYGTGDEHSQRLYNYMSNQWFIPATPVLSNGGAGRGLPISCFVNEVEDSLKSIANTWNENVWLSSKGGGIGTYWGNVRSTGETISKAGYSSGVIPFIHAQNGLSLAISQGSQRRGASAVYLSVSHPEIEEFIDVRRPISGGAPERKAGYLHNGVIIPDVFMQQVQQDGMWDLVSPATQEVVKTVKARDLWIRILTARIETGEPYILFIDTVNKYLPSHLRKLGLGITTSNLCSEITLPTSIDHRGKKRTAVCCLSSVNLAKYDEWKDDELFIYDLMKYLDNILQDFIDNAPSELEAAVYSANSERSVGLGAMGFHSFLQDKGIPFESAIAKSWNKRIFKHIHDKASGANLRLALTRGSCPDAVDAGEFRRFSHMTAIAPNASSSIIAGSVSPGVEPYPSNVYTQKTLSGSFEVRNPSLVKYLDIHNMNTDKVWASIETNGGSIQHLEIPEQDKAVFKTAFEMDQQWVIEHAADRTPMICQSQSINLFLPADISKKELNKLHILAWTQGLKSLYYCRSKAIQRAEFVGRPDLPLGTVAPEEEEECFSCQG